MVVDQFYDVAAGGNISREAKGLGSMKKDISYTSGSKSNQKVYGLALAMLRALLKSGGAVRG